MLTDEELNQILDRSQRMVCDECKQFIPKLINELNHFKLLTRMYRGDILELSKEYNKIKSQFIE